MFGMSKSDDDMPNDVVKNYFDTEMGDLVKRYTYLITIILTYFDLLLQMKETAAKVDGFRNLINQKSYL